MLSDRFGVNAALLVETDECRDESDQCAPREMEIREQCAKVFPLIWQVNEDSRFCGVGKEFAGRL